MTSTMERNKKKTDTLAFCLGILLTAGLVQAAGWLKSDRLVFPDVGEILAAFVRLLGTGKVWRQIGTTLPAAEERKTIRPSAARWCGWASCPSSHNRKPAGKPQVF